MSEWPELRLGELAVFRNGLNFNASARGPGVGVVGIPDFHDKSFVEYDDLEEVQPDVVTSDDALLKQGDIVFVRSNGNRELIGRSLLVREKPPRPTSHSGFTIRLRFTNDQANPLFFAYLLRSDVFRRRMSSQGGGTSINNLNQGILSRLEVPLPDQQTQQRIAAILGAYDDLIEVNRRRVAVLEEMARGLFEEWFVRFRFPGHEDVPIVDTPDGPLPEGWEYAPLKNVLSLRSGFAFKSSTFVDDAPYSIVTIKHVHDGLLKPPFASKVIEPPKKMPEHCKIKEGDILVSLTGNVGRTCLAWGEDLLLNQRVAKVDPSEKYYRAFAYCWFRSTNTLKRLQNIANGAAQQNLSPVQTVGLVIPIPPAPVANMFETVLHPMLQSIVLAHRSNAVLEVQRDLLLPRLISGQLSVEAAERQLEDAA